LRRAEKLNVDFVKLGKLDKKKALSEITAKYNLKPYEIAYIGDDTNDMDIMLEVGISFAVSDSHPEIIKIADVRCTLPGGYGAVREAIDYILQIKQGLI